MRIAIIKFLVPILSVLTVGIVIKRKCNGGKNSQVYKITGLVLMGIGVFAGIVKGLILGVSVFVVGAILFLTSKFLPQW